MAFDGLTVVEELGEDDVAEVCWVSPPTGLIVVVPPLEPPPIQPLATTEKATKKTIKMATVALPLINAHLWGLSTTMSRMRTYKSFDGPFDMMMTN
jgi:hypothetical protein